MKGRAVADFLAYNPIEQTEYVDTWSFPDGDVIHVENDVWHLYFDGASNYMGYGVGILLILPTGKHVPVSIKMYFNGTNNAAEYKECLLGLRSALDLGVKKLLLHGGLSLVINQVGGSWKIKSQSFALYETGIEELEKSSPAYVNAIDDAEEGETEPWTDDGQLYQKTAQGVLLRCIDKPTSEKVMEEVHDGECGPYMNAHMLVCKIIRLVYYRKTTKTDFCKYVRHCHNCQIFANVKHVAPSMLYTMMSPWPISTRGINIIGKVNPSGTGGHCFILVAIGVPHEFISDHGTHFQAQAAVILEKYKIKHHKSSSYRPQTNGVVEAANKTVTVILSKMSDKYRERPQKIPFALWGYKTSIRTATGATPYNLVYGMEAVQLVELEVPSLRILLESQVPDVD
ncbi:uncharacterized protein LOC141630565 [Silene latifolia]|uniref:uncharacterized protein LOC141630565 n=1 Tax=Silene latifolia TaxID=37657 RepID=UPI003D76AF61